MFALKSMHVLSLTNKATCLFCCLESHHDSQELEGMLMLTQGGGKEKEKSRNWDLTLCILCVCKRQNCQLVDNNNVNNNVASSV